MRILKVFSVLLCYPSQELQAAIPEIRDIIVKETRLDGDTRRKLLPLLERLAETDIYELEEEYVMLFDRSRTLSLNLFEHVHGESRDRGSAMVDLLQTYQEAGYDLNTSELPDHLPVLLEFLSTRPEAEAVEVLQDAGSILIALAERLDRRQSDYAAVLHALTLMARADRHNDEAQQLLAETMDNPNDLEALDAVWEETMVTFGPDSMDSCSGLLAGGRAEYPVHIHRASNTQPDNRGE